MEDLDAVPYPDIYLESLLEVFPTLAVMVGQVGNRAKLLKADSLGRLLAAGPASISAVLTAPVPQNTQRWNVDDPSGYAPGDYFVVYPGPNHVGGLDATVYHVNNIDGSAILTTGVQRTSVGAQIGDILARIPRVYERPLAPYKSLGTWYANAPGAGVRANIAIPTIAGQLWAVMDLYASYLNVGGLSATTWVTVSTTQQGTLFQELIGISGATGPADRIEAPEIWITGISNLADTLNIGFVGGPPANDFQAISASFLQPVIMATE